MEKLGKIITTATVLILSIHNSNAQSKATASLENPIAIIFDNNSITDSTQITSSSETYRHPSIGMYLVPSTVGAVTPASFHAKETKAYAETILQADDCNRKITSKQGSLYNLIASNTAKP
jgi:hypothetical protein